MKYWIRCSTNWKTALSVAREVQLDYSCRWITWKCASVLLFNKVTHTPLWEKKSPELNWFESTRCQHLNMDCHRVCWRIKTLFYRAGFYSVWSVAWLYWLLTDNHINCILQFCVIEYHKVTYTSFPQAVGSVHLNVTSWNSVFLLS